MKKQVMVALIKKYEKELSDSCIYTRQLYGASSGSYHYALAQWAAVSDLCHLLCISPDACKGESK